MVNSSLDNNNNLASVCIYGVIKYERKKEI
jgi:hypothetical protein